MIYSLHGELIDSDLHSVVIECGGVGYKCFTTPNTIAELSTKDGMVFIYTVMVVKDDAVDLYGFADRYELDLFKLLTTVNGVGPKAGLSILSTCAPDKLTLYISTEDSKAITSAPGIGLKTAQRIVLELKDKIGKGVLPLVGAKSAVSGNIYSSNTGDAVEALVSFGYTRGDAAMAVGKSDPSETTSQIITEALKVLSRQV